jgi:hypothetical protein
MRSFILALVLASVAAPAAALAQDATGGPPPGTAQQHALFDQVHQQIERLHEQSRAQMLGALTPAHKQLLAQVAGQLAISPNPDFAAAARRIDSALSPAESQSILRTHEAFRQQEHSVMDAAREQFEKTLTPDQQQQMQAHMEQHGKFGSSGQHTMPQLTAGALLLMPGHGPMMMGMPRPPM